MKRPLPDWAKGCLVWGGLILTGWALIYAIGYAIFRGVLSFMALYDND